MNILSIVLGIAGGLGVLWLLFKLLGFELFEILIDVLCSCAELGVNLIGGICECIGSIDFDGGD